MLLESKTLLSSNISYTKLLNFPKIELSYKLTLSFQEAQTWPFWYFQCTLSISGILEVIALNVKIIWEKFGHVTPATEGLFVCNTLQYFAFLFDIVSGSNEVSIYFIFRPVIP